MEKQILIGDYNLLAVENIEELTVQIELGKSQTTITDAYELNILQIPEQNLLPMTVQLKEDIIHMEFNIQNVKPWNTIKDQSLENKLRFCMNLYTLKNFVGEKQTISLATNNVYMDENLIPKILYRGIQQKMLPETFDETMFYTSYQALVIASLGSKYTYEELAAGASKLAKESHLIREIGKCENASAIFHLIEEEYNKEKKRVERQMITVKRTKHKTISRLVYVLAVICVALIGVISYLTLDVIPHQNMLLQANSSFISKDYEATISALKNEEPTKLPQSAKYELAYAYIQGEPLGKEQQTTILNNISLKSEPNYLLFWIYSGAGKYEEALDIAKSLRDVQLIIYGYEKQIDAVNEDKDLSGAEKETLLNTLKEELAKYQETFEKATAEETTNQQ